MKIYVASSWRNETQNKVVDLLRSFGHQVYDFKNPKPGNTGFSWSEVDPDWKNWTPEAYIQGLKHPIAQKGFNSDFDAMKWADICVMVLPCGRSANTEAGWMAGAGKRVYVLQLQKEEPELMYNIYDGIITSLDELEPRINSGSLRSAVEMIAIERQEQIEKHGHTIERDLAENSNEGLVSGAIAILTEENWPWPKHWAKEIIEKIMCKPRKEQLVIAAALLAAEIDCEIVREMAVTR